MGKVYTAFGLALDIGIVFGNILFNGIYKATIAGPLPGAFLLVPRLPPPAFHPHPPLLPGGGDPAGAVLAGHGLGGLVRLVRPGLGGEEDGKRVG